MPPRRKRTSNKKKPSFKKFDKLGVRRIFSPFNKFTITNNNIGMPNKQSQPTGLTCKEKSYILSSCQQRSRYNELKLIASNAIKQNKIFFINGKCNVVRNQLVNRGWVEKISPGKMNLSRIRVKSSGKREICGQLDRLMLSNLVEKHNPSFIWYTRNDYNSTIDMDVDTKEVLINKLKVDAIWTTKQGLCSSVKRNNWFYIEDVAEVNAPRTYNTCNKGEVVDFVNDFRITACTSLLKWVLSMEANDQHVFVASGKITMKTLMFALSRCKEYIFRKQNRDIDRSISNVTTGQWNGFLKRYYRIINKEDVFEADKNNKLPLYLSYAECMLKEIFNYRPQLSCEGCHSIWIFKPTNNCRGRGIRMASKLAVITNVLNKANTAKYVIQKYIEEPLLIHDTKFDIRQYYLVTKTYPLVIWMYRDCYLKFSSQKYDVKNFHESIHLTNNAVQRHYLNCLERHADLPENNMWALNTFKKYLTRIGKDIVWDNIVYSGMKKSIIGIMLSGQDSISLSKNRFELYGCDFILDKQYKPWLIEINSCPDLNSTTQVTARICPDVLNDIIKVVIDYAEDPTASTGNFECIYQQPMTSPRSHGNFDLTIRGFTLPKGYFYNRPILNSDSFYNENIEIETDIIRAVNKFKKSQLDGGVMVDVENVVSHQSDSTRLDVQGNNCTHCTNSELEVSLEAELICDQLDQLINYMKPIETEHRTPLEQDKNF